ncbi:MAG: hypothetical protein MZW92_23810 [Comamonadaceae bacterium]|nr:hypothetical protein [Comamonadaceae bacterium]
MLRAPASCPTAPTGVALNGTPLSRPLAPGSGGPACTALRFSVTADGAVRPRGRRRPPGAGLAVGADAAERIEPSPRSRALAWSAAAACRTGDGVATPSRHDPTALPGSSAPTPRPTPPPCTDAPAARPPRPGCPAVRPRGGASPALGRRSGTLRACRRCSSPRRSSWWRRAFCTTRSCAG